MAVTASYLKYINMPTTVGSDAAVLCGSNVYLKPYTQTSSTKLDVYPTTDADNTANAGTVANHSTLDRASVPHIACRRRQPRYKLNTQIDLFGMWKECVPGSEYSVERSNTELVVKLYTAGSHKVNYMLGE